MLKQVYIVILLVFIPTMNSLLQRFRFFKTAKLFRRSLCTTLKSGGGLVEEGLVVRLSDGKKGRVVAGKRGGWWTVTLQEGSEAGKVVKVRANAITVIDSVNGSEISLPTTDKMVLTSSSLSKNVVGLQTSVNTEFFQSASTSTTSNKSRIEENVCVEVPTINAPLAHQAKSHWVIFSDLHVKAASIDICEDVLSRVHREAVLRDAGIIFLGDFWHVRGALNVDLLNRILRSLSYWTQPVIMIPGNHDQVTLGGAVHSLEPLQYAFKSKSDPDSNNTSSFNINRNPKGSLYVPNSRPEENGLDDISLGVIDPDATPSKRLSAFGEKNSQILLISEPVVCLGALWIPYRRDQNIMRSVLRQAFVRY